MRSNYSFGRYMLEGLSYQSPFLNSKYVLCTQIVPMSSLKMLFKNNDLHTRGKWGFTPIFRDISLVLVVLQAKA